MLSTFVSTQITLSLTPFLHDIQTPKSPKYRKNFKTTKNCDRNYPQKPHSYSFENSPLSLTDDFSSSYGVSRSKESPGVTLFDNSSSTQLVDYKVIASELQTCSTTKEVSKFHAIAVKCLRSPVTFVDNNLISAYLRFGDLVEARKVFDKMLERDVVSWTAILNGYLRFGFLDKALWLFRKIVESGIQANSTTFVCILSLCSSRFDYELGQQIHACIVKRKCSNLFVDSAMVYFYAQCADLLGAFRVFDRMPTHDVVSWTTMITACSQLGYGEEAIWLFSRMLSERFAPNEFTVCSVLNACGDEEALELGKQLHGATVKIFEKDVFIGTSLVDMYAKCGEIAESRKVFDRMRKRNTVTWTSLIAGYARNELVEDAISLFRIMKRRNIYANNLTMVSILRACGLVGGLLLGKEVHAFIIKNTNQGNMYVGNTLVWLYCKCSEYSSASKVLQEMPFRDVVSWTAMISGCAGLGHESEALEFLKEMLGEGVVPNPLTYSSALKACARLENVQQGRLIHSSVNKTLAFSNVYVGSALVFMYSKCGYVTEAIQVFDNMPERNLVSWKAMILGYAKNGLCQQGLKLMYRSQAEGFEVDDNILATVLIACGDIDRKTEQSPEHCLQST